MFSFHEIAFNPAKKVAIDVDIDKLNQFVERYACRVPNFYRHLLEQGR